MNRDASDPASPLPATSLKNSKLEILLILHSSNRLNTSAAFVPPNRNHLRARKSPASLGTGSAHNPNRNRGRDFHN